MKIIYKFSIKNIFTYSHLSLPCFMKKYVTLSIVKWLLLKPSMNHSKNKHFEIALFMKGREWEYNSCSFSFEVCYVLYIEHMCVECSGVNLKAETNHDIYNHLLTLG